VLLPVVGRQPGAWVVHTPCSNSALVSRATPVATPKVVLDPGHGGDETGAVGPNGLRESVVNMAVARQAEAALTAAGVSVLLTRSGEYRETLSTRTDVVTRLRPAAFVSVHHNSGPDGPHDGPGSETYYQFRSPSSKRLAGLIYEEVAKALSAYRLAWVGNVDAGAKYRLNDRGGDYYHVLREAAGVTSALAELAFLSNPLEAELVARPDVQQVEGQAVARGILRYLRTNDPGSGFVTPVPRTTPAPGGGAEGCVDPPL
jgi:N-acetylmuramoyl-L-alanine amidase